MPGWLTPHQSLPQMRLPSCSGASGQEPNVISQRGDGVPPLTSNYTCLVPSLYLVMKMLGEVVIGGEDVLEIDHGREVDDRLMCGKKSSRRLHDSHFVGIRKAELFL